MLECIIKVSVSNTGDYAAYILWQRSIGLGEISKLVGELIGLSHGLIGLVEAS